jgi:hypothetical protein
MVLCIARQGIHINRTEYQQRRFIARQGIHLFSVDASPDGEEETGGTRFSIDMNALTGNAQNHAARSITTDY